MRWCSNCVLPDTRPRIVIKDDSICNACSNVNVKVSKICWESRKIEFENIVQKVKSSSNYFDCLIPVSGGKDSTWQVVTCLEHDLRPLTVTWKPPSRTKIGQENLDNLIKLGVDHIDWQINPEVEKSFLLSAFRKYGSTAIPMHMAIFNIPIKVAFSFNIPLIVWGENSAFEYGSGGNDSLTGNNLTFEWIKKFGVTHGTTAEDWISQDLSRKDLSSYFGPTKEQLDSTKLEAIFLGHYFRWDVETSLKVASQHGFKSNLSARTGIYNYADIDDDFISIHHWLKWYKFGITRTFDNLSIEIRNGRLTRNQAIDILVMKGEERPDVDIESFCSFTGLSLNEFNKIAEGFRNTKIWSKDNGVWKIKDFLIKDWKWNEN
jgi:N-acetyl sugar amidotransferase